MLNLRSTSPGTIMAARASHRQLPTSTKVASNEQDWDTSLHLPPWVSSNERLQIEAKLDQWVRDLCQVTLLQPAVALLQCLRPSFPDTGLPASLTQLKSMQPTLYLQLCSCHCISAKYLMTNTKLIHVQLWCLLTLLCSCVGPSNASMLCLQVTGDVGRLAAVLDKPLRPIWLSQESRMWLNEMADHADLPFTPLYLVSASKPQPERQAIGQPLSYTYLLSNVSL